MPVRTAKARRAFGRLERNNARKPSRMSGKRSPLHPDHGEFFAALGRRLKELRKERGWSLHTMVAVHGYYDAQWRKYEKGGPVTVDSLLKMATMFGVTLNTLMDDLGEWPRQDVTVLHQKPTAQKKSVVAAKRTPAKRVIKKVIEQQPPAMTF